MPNITSHKQGTPSWADLSTTDQPAAKRFYGSLFGWQWDDQDMGGGEFYSMAKLKGRSAAAVSTQRPDEKQMGIPAHWNTYITVDDVDAATKKVAGAGGTVFAEPFDVFDSGRMSVIADPTGAVVSLWQAKSHIGSEIMHEPGALAWTELLTDDVKKAGDFFVNLLGVKLLRQEGPMPYTMIEVGGKPVAGLWQKTGDMGQMPNAWAVYFAVADCDSAAKKAESLGGKVLMPPMDTPGGRFAMFQDPQGAVSGIVKLRQQ